MRVSFYLQTIIFGYTLKEPYFTAYKIIRWIRSPLQISKEEMKKKVFPCIGFEYGLVTSTTTGTTQYMTKTLF